jgi:ABC-type branched-subunit amino acid transport system ATPase component/ABC-type branched-subunit amino acid transport system permease subunit
VTIDLESLIVIASITILMALSIYLPITVGDLFMLPIATMAIGAYTFGYTTIHGWPLLVAMLLSIVLAAVVATVGGALVLRLQGFSTALASLAMALIIQVFFMNFAPTGGIEGLAQVPPLASAPITLGAAAAIVGSLAAAEISRHGRISRAILQDALAAEAVGINVRLFRLGLFTASGAISGLAGAFTAGYLTFIDPTQFGFSQLTNFVLAAMLGGSTTVAGPVLGGGLTTVLPEFVRFMADYRLLTYSVLVIVVILVRKEGLVTHRDLSWMVKHLKWRSGRSRRPSQAPWTALQGGATFEAVRFGKKFGGQRVLHEVSLRAEPGSILVVIGPNGAGKTTLLNVITATVSADVGEVRLDGKRIRCRAPHEAVQEGIARTFQNLRLFGDLTVAENVSLTDPALAAPLLEFVGLSHVADSAARTLPYGQQRRLEIARALNTRPRVLLLDEPTAGMSPAEAADVAELLRVLREQMLTVILIDHNLRFVMQVADRVLVMDAGEVIAEGTPNEIRANPKVIEAYLGTRAILGSSNEAGIAAPAV